MHRINQIILWLSLSTASAMSTGQTTPVSELVLKHYWELTGVDHFEPSGLSVCHNQLVTVSDRHSDQVFSIPRSPAATSRVEPFRSRLQVVDLPSQMRWQDQLTDTILRWTDKRLDWEGIHCDSRGTLYLASESLSAIAKVNPDGRLQWITPSLAAAVKKQGFINRINTGFEGVGVVQNQLFVALEREPRGLLTAQLHPPELTIERLQPVDEEGVSSHLSADFTGLWLEPTHFYTLERNYFRVCKRRYGNWQIEQCWSYQRTEKSATFRFHNDHYGMAEGIARLNNHLYIVLDNNQSPRRQTNRPHPLLFQFELPDGW